MIKGIIDRFESDFAIVEIEGQVKVISKNNIPADAREGDVLVFERNNWSIDQDATINVKKQTEARMERMWKD